MTSEASCLHWILSKSVRVKGWWILLFATLFNFLFVFFLPLQTGFSDMTVRSSYLNGQHSHQIPKSTRNVEHLTKFIPQRAEAVLKASGIQMNFTWIESLPHILRSHSWTFIAIWHCGELFDTTLPCSEIYMRIRNIAMNGCVLWWCEHPSRWWIVQSVGTAQRS